MNQETQQIEGVNGREKVLMFQDDAGWYWRVHEHEDSENIVYESLYFQTLEEAEKHLESTAELLEGYLPEPVFYIHDGQWWWQYHERDADAPLLSAGPFPTEKKSTENREYLTDLVLGWGGPKKDEN